MKIRGVRAWLHDKHVRAAHIFQNLKINFAVAELAKLGFSQLHAQMAADILRQPGIRATAENLEFVVDQVARPFVATTGGSRFRADNGPQPKQRLQALQFQKLKKPVDLAA